MNRIGKITPHEDGWDVGGILELHDGKTAWLDDMSVISEARRKEWRDWLRELGYEQDIPDDRDLDQFLECARAAYARRLQRNARY